MPKFTIYIERRKSTTVTVEAPTVEAALSTWGEHDPGDSDDGTDWSGDWEALTVEDDQGRELWQDPSLRPPIASSDADAMIRRMRDA